MSKGTRIGKSPFDKFLRVMFGEDRLLKGARCSPGTKDMNGYCLTRVEIENVKRARKIFSEENNAIKEYNKFKEREERIEEVSVQYAVDKSLEIHSQDLQVKLKESKKKKKELAKIERQNYSDIYELRSELDSNTTDVFTWAVDCLLGVSSARTNNLSVARNVTVLPAIYRYHHMRKTVPKLLQNVEAILAVAGVRGARIETGELVRGGSYSLDVHYDFSQVDTNRMRVFADRLSKFDARLKVIAHVK